MKYVKSTLNNMIEKEDEAIQKKQNENQLVKENGEEDEEFTKLPKVQHPNSSLKVSKLLTQIDESSIEQEDEKIEENEKNVEVVHDLHNSVLSHDLGDEEEKNKRKKDDDIEEKLIAPTEIKSDNDFNWKIEDSKNNGESQNEEKNTDGQISLSPQSSLENYQPIRKHSIKHIHQTLPNESKDQKEEKKKSLLTINKEVEDDHLKKPLTITNNKDDREEANKNEDDDLETFFQEVSRTEVCEGGDKLSNKPLTSNKLNRTTKSRYDHIGPKVDSFWSDGGGGKEVTRSMKIRGGGGNYYKGTGESHDILMIPSHSHCFHLKGGCSSCEFAKEQYAKINPHIINQTVEKYLRK